MDQTMTFAEVIANPRFAPVSFLQTIARSAVIASGMAQVDPEIAGIVAGFSSSGPFPQLDRINLPLLKDVDTPDQVLTDTKPIETSKTTMAQDVCSIVRTGHAFARSDLSHSMNTTDPMLAIANALADYWNRRYQEQLMAVLSGIFASNVATNGSDLVMDISGEEDDDGILTGNAMLIAAQMLGDVKENLVAIACHSEVETFLNIIGAIPPMTGAPKDNPKVVSTWNQRAIIMDDACYYNPTTKTADIILFKRGAIALNNVPVAVPYELDRDSKAGKDWFISRRGRIIHHRGVKYTGASQVLEHATNEEYAKAANWTRLVEKKRMGVVKLRVRLG